MNNEPSATYEKKLSALQTCFRVYFNALTTEEMIEVLKEADVYKPATPRAPLPDVEDIQNESFTGGMESVAYLDKIRAGGPILTAHPLSAGVR